MMKSLLFLAIICIFVSCKGEELQHKIIHSKTNVTDFGNELPNNWCRFFYKKYPNSYSIEFREECDKYQVGDTIY